MGNINSLNLLVSDCDSGPCQQGVCTELGGGGYFCSCKPGKVISKVPNHNRATG